LELLRDRQSAIESMDGQDGVLEVGAEGPREKTDHIGHENLCRDLLQTQRITHQAWVERESGVKGATRHVNPAPQRLY
jgi:hypothetical protein